MNMILLERSGEFIMLFKEDIITALDKSSIQYSRGVFFKTVATDVSKIKLESFDLLVFYSPRDIDSLYKNFPDFKSFRNFLIFFMVKGVI